MTGGGDEPSTSTSDNGQSGARSPTSKVEPGGFDRDDFDSDDEDRGNTARVKRKAERKAERKVERQAKRGSKAITSASVSASVGDGGGGSGKKPKANVTNASAGEPAAAAAAPSSSSMALAPAKGLLAPMRMRSRCCRPQRCASYPRRATCRLRRERWRRRG